MKYHFFLDETGDHGLGYIDKNFPIFLLCGCLFREDDLNEIETKINTFKIQYFKTTQVILHSREIRKCEGPFQILFNLDLKANFYTDLNKIIRDTNYKIIGAGINKEKHIKKYGKSAKDPYSLSLSFIIERLMFCLSNLDKNGTVEIKVEERGRKEDTLLLSHFNSILDRGTYYIGSQRLKKTILSFGFYSKKENTMGLQIADLCAYQLAKHLLNPEVPYIPFDIIEKKIYSNKKGEYKGWGLKIFP
ncbi:MAG: DUF3800 domain-containing protein [Proteobacteria bacterium]|nr:DUF3800 domain-containing protein [Pseudomonadota bacterium]